MIRPNGNSFRWGSSHDVSTVNRKGKRYPHRTYRTDVFVSTLEESVNVVLVSAILSKGTNVSIFNILALYSTQLHIQTRE